MRTRIPGTIRKYLGWCPNARALRTSRQVLQSHTKIALAVKPDGGSGRPGRIDRGIGLAAGSIKILVRN